MKAITLPNRTHLKVGDIYAVLPFTSDNPMKREVISIDGDFIRAYPIKGYRQGACEQRLKMSALMNVEVIVFNPELNHQTQTP